MTETKTSDAGVAGQKSPSSSASDFNAKSFLVQQLLGRVRTVQVAKVMAVTTTGAVAAVGTVDVQLMVNMLDGNNQATEHGTIFTVPYFRLQGGKNAVIIDPQVGDIGMVAVADRDISAVRKSKKVSNPGSLRRFDLADSLYFGGFLGEAPTQYVRFVQDEDGEPAGLEAVDALGNSIKTSADGIVAADLNENKIEMVEAGIKINGVLFDRNKNISAAAKIDATGEITAKAGSGSSVTLTGHKHGTGSPQPAGTVVPTGGT